MNIRVLVISTVCMGMLSSLGPVLAQTTWYVDAGAVGPGSGTQTNPFISIQAGIDAASNGDTVLVLPGTYVEVVVIVKCVAVVSTGGASVTIIDGNQVSSVVTFYNTPSPGGRLEGFTVTGGQGVNGPDGPVALSLPLGWLCPSPTELAGLGGAAGGINCGLASPLIRDCVITGNSGGRGGNGGACYQGINSMYGWQTVSAAPGGPGGPGGVLLVDSAAQLENCSIVANAGGDGGTGGSGYASNIMWPDSCANGPGGDGGAGGVRSQSSGPSPTVVGCVIANNQAGNGGDAGSETSSEGPCGIADGGRGGVGGGDVSPGQIGSSTVGANVGGAGGLGSPSSSPFGPGGLPGPMGGGGVFGSTVINSIVWANTPDDISGPAAVTYSNLGVSVPGVGNISTDPQFVDAPSGDFHILATSPCVDAGDANASPLPTLDIDGDPRVFHGALDMGADETVLALLWEQTGGSGTPLSLSDHNLTTGNEYHNIFSLDPCPGGPGTGPHLGLCLATQPNYLFILEQIQAPLGTPLFHFTALQSPTFWGPYPIPPMTVDGIVFDFTGGVIGAVSPVTRIVVQ